MAGYDWALSHSFDQSHYENRMSVGVVQRDIECKRSDVRRRRRRISAKGRDVDSSTWETLEIDLVYPWWASHIWFELFEKNDSGEQLPFLC
ncbi:uncharacterized protein PITG_02310 [Phytophthora infestans T30-4]|uniref:Uncharacterized protein n=1 Tax=Phytophthora infestans (strain T30-4) TaxID=403677 RepID=D0MW04_PHYIT|nr:uncharacterized protein PITG_02310 [Phytophthora infestans T30-4]EEY63817.1 hypothetical protein PITG_02310 [Phytophthora infestans T30-4]|eukprot:XP_002907253.1 hypothetical protein PITG_02310 [Phytophthora infestans T30-4]